MLSKYKQFFLRFLLRVNLYFSLVGLYMFFEDRKSCFFLIIITIFILNVCNGTPTKTSSKCAHIFFCEIKTQILQKVVTQGRWIPYGFPEESR